MWKPWQWIKKREAETKKREAKPIDMRDGRCGGL
jgi:hypothetical protein